MNIRSIALGLLAAAVAAVAAAADKRIPLDTGDTFIINWGADWKVGENTEDAPPGTVTIHGTNAALWRITVAPLPPHPTLTGDIGNLRIYVRTLARGLENGGVEVFPEHKPIDGGSAHGFYFKAHDGRTKTKAQIRKAGGNYTDTYMGAIAVGSKPYLFEVVWVKGGEAEANTALAAIKTIRIQ